MLFVTGDTHGDFRRFSQKCFPEQKDMSRDDYVLICGDFGGVWDGSKAENNELDLLNSRSFTTLFVDGNHENFDLLNAIPGEEWQGGMIRRVRPHILHLQRGQVYNIDGRIFFTMGGASSHDIKDGVLEPDDPHFKRKRHLLDQRRALYRVNHRSWWRQELPSDEEYDIALANLERVNWRADYVVTHCAPSQVVDELGQGSYDHDRLTDFFSLLRHRLTFRRWLFGHYHDNRAIGEKYILLYEQIARLL